MTMVDLTAIKGSLKGNGILGIRRETKNKWEGRVPLSPEHVRQLVGEGITVIVQPSTIRCFTDIQFERAGAIIREDLSPCSVILGVKEVPIKDLLPGRTYMFFSHTIKAQPYNMPLLDHIIDNNIRLIDYEKITDSFNKRLVRFGPFAGYAGMLDTLCAAGNKFMALGYKTPFLHLALSRYYPSLTAAHTALQDVGMEIKENGLPKALCPFTITLTGTGSVSQGAQAMLKFLPCKYVKAAQLKEIWESGEVDQHCVYVCIATSKDMVAHKGGDAFSKTNYYAHPEEYEPVFHKNVFPYTRVLVNCMYWDFNFPRLVTIQQARDLALEGRCPCVALGDITCDPKGSVQFFVQSTTIDEPLYVFDLMTGKISFNINDPGIVVQGVDHLPAEFPTQASEFFGDQLMPFIRDVVYSDGSKDWAENDLPAELAKAVIVSKGALTPDFEYITELRKKHKPNVTRILLLGAGLVSSQVVKYLHKYKRNHITIGSMLLEEALTACEDYDRTAPVQIKVDEDVDKLDTLVREHDIVISLVPPSLHHVVAQTCIRHKKNLVTASYIAPEMRELDAAAKEAGIIMLNELGLDPGISHMAAMRLVQKIKEKKGKIVGFEAYTGALPAPQFSNNPLGYKFSWSPIGALQSSQKGCTFLYDGSIVEIPEKLKHYTPKKVDLFKGFNFELIPNRDSTHYKEQYHLGDDCKTVLRGSFRYTGFSYMIGALTALNLLSEDKIPFDVTGMSWRDFIKKLTNWKEGKVRSAVFEVVHKAMLEMNEEVKKIQSEWITTYSDLQIREHAMSAVEGIKQLGMISEHEPLTNQTTFIRMTCDLLSKKLVFEEGETDMNIILTTVVAEIEDRVEKHWSTLFTFGDDDVTATSQTVGLPVAIAAELVLDGTIKGSGVHGPLEPSIYEPLLERLATEGIKLKEYMEVVV